MSGETPASLSAGESTASGDWIADLRGFPVAVYVAGDHGCTDVTAQLPALPDVWTAARDWLVGFTERTGLQDILAVDGYGLWWTLNGQRFVAGLSELGNVFAWIDLLLAARDHDSHQKLHSVQIHGNHAAVALLAKQVWPKAEIRVAPASQRGARARGTAFAADTANDAGASVPRQIGLLVARTIIGLLYLVYGWIRRPAVCLFTDTNLLRTVGLGPDRKRCDVYLGDVASAMRSRGWRVTVVEKYGSNANWAGLRARGWFFPSDVVFLLAAIKSAKVPFSRGPVRRWQGRWREVQPALARHLQYRGVDIAPLVLPMLETELCSHAPDLEAMVGLWRTLFKLWRPRILYVNNAYGRGAVPAIIAAKGLHIPSIEQQHGLIGRNHFAYLVPRHLDLRSHYPLCDAMAVWGEFTQRFLVSAGVYEPSSAVVCGFPRTDLLLGQLPSREETRAQLGIPPNAAVVLYTSNAFAQDAMGNILEGIRQAENRSRVGSVKPGPGHVHWIIKLHPREMTRQRWESAISEGGFRKMKSVRVHVLQGGIDFYALLAACDIHVSFASTTLIEAAILGKPNLGLDLANVSDPAGYRQAGAFLPVRPAELGSVVLDLLADKTRYMSLVEVQKAFAEDWCVHDGHAVERIVALVESKLCRRDRDPGRLRKGY